MRKKAPKDDRRSSPRRVPRVGATIRVRRPGGDNLSETWLNVSEGGVGVILSEALAVGEPIELVLQAFGLPEPIRLGAAVIWCKPTRLDPSRCGAGIAFARPLTSDEFTALALP